MRRLIGLAALAALWAGAAQAQYGALYPSALPSAPTTTPYCGSGAIGGAAACGAALVLPNGATATTQSAGDSSTKLATTAFVAAAVAPLGAAVLIASSQTVTLPAGWHGMRYKLLSGAGGSGCGTVVTSGTAVSGGGTGGTGVIVPGAILASQVGNATSLTVTIGAAGASCTASGTTNGSTGSAPTAGGNTSITIGGWTHIVYGAGAGSNGSTANSAGGGSGGTQQAGSNASGATAGGNGSVGGVTGGSGAGGNCPDTYNIWTCSGGGDAVGSAPTPGFGRVAQEQPSPGCPGAGLAATPVAIAGCQGTAPVFYEMQPSQRGTAGAATCTGGSQNASSSSWTGIGFYGVGGASGASCIAANGGNGGSAAGYGASGGGGGATLAGNVAGSAGASTGGAVWMEVY